MAASNSVTLTCRKCARTVTVTNTTEGTAGNSKEIAYKCPECGNPMGFWISKIIAVHSANVGSNTTITHTMATPGTISTAVS